MNLLRAPWRLMRFEAGLWRSLWLLVRGRQDGVRSGTTAVDYHRATASMWTAGLVVTAVEVPVAHLLVPWAAAKAVLVIVGVWTLLLIGGMWASYRVRPYLIGPDGIRLRHGPLRDLTLPWSQVSSVDARTVRSWQDTGMGTAVVVEGDRLGYVVAGCTSVAITLTGPLTVPAGRGRTAEVSEVHVGADEPSLLRAALDAHRTPLR